MVLLNNQEYMIKKAQVYRRKGIPNPYQVSLLGGFTVVS